MALCRSAPLRDGCASTLGVLARFASAHGVRRSRPLTAYPRFMTPSDAQSFVSREEVVHTTVAVARFHWSVRPLYGVKHLVLTTTRLIAISEKGLFKKRLDMVADWPLDGFTSRINLNEGTALGPYTYNVTLFTADDETVTAGFRAGPQRDAFHEDVSEVIIAANGW